ncbi:MAG: LLM class flavin-dependent oxidoreductase, partial [Salinirussus sp.]
MASFDFGVHYSCQSPDGDWEHVYTESINQARTAEELGFTTFSVSEHHFLEDGWVPTPEILLGAIAAVTGDVRIGTNVTLLPLQNPIQVAERAAVLDTLTGGGFRLGVSIGWRAPEFAGFGIDRAERVPRVVEGIDLVRRLLTERNVSFDGEFYDVDDITITPRPVQNEIPIWYGGMAEPAIRRAADVADAWSISPFETPAELADRLS